MPDELMRPGHHTTIEGEAAKGWAAFCRRFMDLDFQRVADRVCEALPSNSGVNQPVRLSLLELGSGPGGIAIKIAARLPQAEVIGLDSSQTLVNLATEQSQAEGLVDSVRFRYWDRLPLALPDESFDLAYANWSLHHWVQPLTVLNELHRVLVKGGRALLIDMRRDAPEHLLEEMTAHVPEELRRRSPISVKDNYVAAEVEQMLRQTAFGSGQVIEDGAHLVVRAQK